eukprot:TRINITY_DN64079_c1_g1_i1.p1 TRINITY_DN64079_c1_g1~~TRINITY_DN64079_c1_g1_i1.p1  ORF type:complete len:297 (+),score=-3.30 TRINITY_DN64079_c1_g1_i1:35-925(+)
MDRGSGSRGWLGSFASVACTSNPLFQLCQRGDHQQQHASSVPLPNKKPRRRKRQPPQLVVCFRSLNKNNYKTREDEGVHKFLRRVARFDAAGTALTAAASLIPLHFGVSTFLALPIFFGASLSLGVVYLLPPRKTVIGDDGFTRTKNFPGRLLFGTSYCFFQGLLVGTLLNTQPFLVTTATCITIPIVLGLGSYSVDIFSSEIVKLGPAMNTALFGLITLPLATIYVPFWSPVYTVSTLLGLATMCGYQVYDTSIAIEAYKNEHEYDHMKVSSWFFMNGVGFVLYLAKLYAENTDD